MILVTGNGRNLAVIVDNVDIDNPMAAIAAAGPVLGLPAQAVVVTGRPAHSDPKASIGHSQLDYSAQVRRRNTRRMKGVLQRHGLKLPVYEGLIAPRTIVPHSRHIDERLLDPYFDEEYVRQDGSFDDAVTLLAATEGPIDLVVGGPLTEVARLLDEPAIAPRLGRLVCQLGMFGSAGIQLMAGGRRQFNAACDPAAVSKVLSDYPGSVYLVPIDVTEDPRVGFSDPLQLRRYGVSEELIWLYVTFWSRALKHRGEHVYPHDLHTALAMAQLYGVLPGLYQFQPHRITGVAADGTISAEPDAMGDIFIAVSVEPALFLAQMSRVCRGR